MNQSAAGSSALSFRSVLGLAATILVLGLFVAGLRSYRDLSVQQARQAALSHRIASAKQRIEELENRIELLRTDPGTLERAAREDLGMVRPGDVVVRLDTLESSVEINTTPDS